MKHRRLLCTAAIVAGLIAATGLADNPSQLQIQVRKTQVRSAPEPLGTVIGEVELGEKVRDVDGKPKTEGWVMIESMLRTKVVGWIRRSAVSPTKVDIAAADGRAKSVSALEAQMAGEGIASGERKYVNTNNLHGAQAQLDQLEKNPLTKVSVQDIRSFVNEGRLSQGGN